MEVEWLKELEMEREYDRVDTEDNSVDCLDDDD